LQQDTSVPESAREILFYDGGCGLCHRTVRFVLWADRTGDRFRFAPLNGELFRKLVSEARRVGLPDSIVLRAADDSLLVRSAAMLYVLRRLGGWWVVLAVVLKLVPMRWRDALYDFIARRRRAWFRPRADVCPDVPAHLRSRFLV